MSSSIPAESSSSSSVPRKKRLAGRWGERERDEQRNNAREDAIDQPQNQHLATGRKGQSADTRSPESGRTATEQDHIEPEQENQRELNEEKGRAVGENDQVEHQARTAGKEDANVLVQQGDMQHQEDTGVLKNDPEEENYSDSMPQKHSEQHQDDTPVVALRRLEMDIAGKSSRRAAPTGVLVERDVENNDMTCKRNVGGRSESHDCCEGDIEEDSRPRQALAVATPVVDGGRGGGAGRKSLPCATEETTDLSAKPPIYKNRRFRMYRLAVGLMSLILAVGIIVIVVIRKWQQNDSSAPLPDPATARTAAPTTERQGEITKQLEAVVGGPEKFAEADSPHRKALNWIVGKDPRQLEPNSPNLVQRFLLALFYFETSQDGPWASCDPPPLDSDSSASCIYEPVLTSYPEGNDIVMTPAAVPSFRWLSRRRECDWAGVFCDESEGIRMIKLVGQGLSGELPAYFGYFHLLQSIDLSFNYFVGTVPTSWAQMQHMLAINMRQNVLGGTFPQELLGLSNLQRLDLRENQFTGTIPPEVADLTGLDSLLLSDNGFTGTIPTEFGNLRRLELLFLLNNRLEGTLPTELGTLYRLQGLRVGRNPRITGTIPTELGQLDLHHFYAQFTSLEGTLPAELLKPNLRFLYLNDGNITGTLNPSIGRCQTLISLRLHNNRFYGPVPTELGLLTNLGQLRLQFNDFSGHIPQEVCNLRGPDGLNLLDADCFPEGGDGDIRIECPVGCCTNCCDPIFEECVPWDGVGS